MQFLRRVSAAMRLRPQVFSAVEIDFNAFHQAAIVVAVSAAAMRLGLHGPTRLGSVLAVAAGAILLWVLWSWIAFAVGSTILKEPQTNATWGQLLRTTGFAAAPGVIAIAGVLRPLAGFAVAAAAVWILVASVVAVREALDYKSTVRAVVVTVLATSVPGGVLALVATF